MWFWLICALQSWCSPEYDPPPSSCLLCSRLRHSFPSTNRTGAFSPHPQSIRSFFIHAHFTALTATIVSFHPFADMHSWSFIVVSSSFALHSFLFIYFSCAGAFLSDPFSPLFTRVALLSLSPTIRSFRFLYFPSFCGVSFRGFFFLPPIKSGNEVRQTSTPLPYQNGSRSNGAGGDEKTGTGIWEQHSYNPTKAKYK